MTKKQLIVGLLVSVSALSSFADKSNEVVKSTQPKHAMDVLAGSTITTDAKIGVVDSFAAMGESVPGQEARKDFEKVRQELGKDLQKDEQKIAQAMSEYKSKSTTLSETAREKEEKKLMKMEREYKNKIQESEYELKLDMQKKTEYLAHDMDSAIVKMAQEEGLDIVFDRVGRVMYTSDKFDFTKEAIDKINTEHQVKLAQNKENVAKPSVSLAENKKTSGKSAKANA